MLSKFQDLKMKKLLMTIVFVLLHVVALILIVITTKNLLDTYHGVAKGYKLAGYYSYRQSLVPIIILSVAFFLVVLGLVFDAICALFVKDSGAGAVAIGLGMLIATVIALFATFNSKLLIADGIAAAVFSMGVFAMILFALNQFMNRGDAAQKADLSELAKAKKERAALRKEVKKLNLAKEIDELQAEVDKLRAANK